MAIPNQAFSVPAISNSFIVCTWMAIGRYYTVQVLIIFLISNWRLSLSLTWTQLWPNNGRLSAGVLCLQSNFFGSGFVVNFTSRIRIWLWIWYAFKKAYDVPNSSLFAISYSFDRISSTKHTVIRNLKTYFIKSLNATFSVGIKLIWIRIQIENLITDLDRESWHPNNLESKRLRIRSKNTDLNRTAPLI